MEPENLENTSKSPGIAESSKESGGHALPKGRGYLCPDCEHLNPLNLLKCEFCATDLFMACGHCGAEMQTVLSRCPKCRRKVKQRKTLRKKRSKRRFNLMLFLYSMPIDKVVVLLAAIFGALFFIFFLTRL